MTELRVSARSSMTPKRYENGEMSPHLFHPPRWEFAMTDGSASPIQKVPTNISVHHPVGRTGMRQDIHLVTPGYFELEDMTNDTFFLDVNRRLDGGFPFLCVSDRDKIPLVDRVTVDVRAAGYVNPVATLGIMLMCEALHDIFGRKVGLLLPDDDDSDGDVDPLISACMRSPDFRTVVRNIADIEGRPAVCRNSDIVLLRKIASPGDILKVIVVLDELKDVWSGSIDLVSVVSEFCNNILDHSRPDGDPHGHLAIQMYDGVLQLAVADLGVGIPTTLKNTAQCRNMSDIEILRVACELGVSSKGDDRGLGLTTVLEAVRKALGHLNIRSGNASVLFGYDMDSERRRREQYADADVHRHFDLLHGTQIGLLVPPGGNRKGNRG